MKMNAKQLVAAAVLSVVGVEAVAGGEVIEHDLKITMPQPVPALFGDSVSLAGSVAVVSATAGTNGMNYGAAYALDVNTGELLFELVPEPDGENQGYDLVGRAIASTEQFAVVTAMEFGFRGIAKVFDLTTGQQILSLSPEYVSENSSHYGFGVSVAANGSYIAIGAPYDHVSGLYDTAPAEVYLFDATTGEQLFKFAPEHGIHDPVFGESVAVSDTVVVVSNGGDEGLVSVYDISTGDLRFNLSTPELEGMDDWYGLKLAVTDSLIAVGVPYEEVPGNGNGSVYIFDAQTGNLLRTLSVDNEDQNNLFGWSIDLDGSIAVIGTRGSSEIEAAPGAAYVFDLNTGELLHELVPDEDSLIDDFGYSVAIDGSMVLVGKPHDAEMGFGAGAAYRFDLPLGCPGDATGDGAVDLADLNLVLANFGGATTEGDANGDGQVDLADLNLVLANFGSNCD